MYMLLLLLFDPYARDVYRVRTYVVVAMWHLPMWKLPKANAQHTAVLVFICGVWKKGD